MAQYNSTGNHYYSVHAMLAEETVRVTGYSAPCHAQCLISPVLQRIPITYTHGCAMGANVFDWEADENFQPGDNHREDDVGSTSGQCTRRGRNADC